MSQNFRNKSIDPSRFAMIPRADVPRSVFHVENAHKTTFDAGYLVPVYLNEVLPGDSFRLEMTAFTRMATPIFPLMDNLQLCSFFFFVPNRLVWENWQRFMGERDPDPDSSVDYVVPVTTSPVGGYNNCTLQDFFGLPVYDQQVTGAVTHNVLPLRAYNLIWNEWFRDENLQQSQLVHRDDGPDDEADYVLLRRGKRHDYFTSALPWPQKGDAATIPLQGSAPVLGIGVGTPVSTAGAYVYSDWFGSKTANNYSTVNQGTPANPTLTPAGQSSFLIEQDATTGFPKIYADLSNATAVTINALRQSFQVQKLLERDARGGTRYTEILRAHFGVISPDARLQRPEYLGGGCSPININPVAQTGPTDSTSPQGNLAGVGTGVAHHGFSKSFVEHGYIIGLVNVRADLTYQQGLHKMWSRNTRYDFYWPAFAHLGEQAVLRKEIWVKGDPTSDNVVFGYQERFAEYRYKPSQITGMFRSHMFGTMDAWHLSQYFTTAPTLSAEFIEEHPPVNRVVAAGDNADFQQFLFDSVFSCRMVRPMPMYGVPGFIDRF